MKAKEFTFNVFTSQLNPDRELKPSSILDIFQYAAGLHAEEFNLDSKTLEKYNYIWLVAENKYEIITKPQDFNEVIVKTFPIEGRVKYLRDYLIYDKEGNLIIKGTSTWCILNLDENNFVISKTLQFPHIFEEERVFKDPLEKIKALNKEELQHCKSFIINKSHYDSNNHVNNSCYGNFIYDSLNKDEEIKKLKIDYINQLFLDQTLEVYKKQINEKSTYFAGFFEDKLIFKAICEVAKNEIN